ncbi:MAG: YafY family protein, partial [Rhodanobacter sp.]
HGAYMLLAGFKLPPMMFTNDEAVALSVGLAAARGLGLAESSPAVESVQAKLSRVMPEKLKGQAGAIAKTVTIDLHPSPGTSGGHAALVALTTAAQAQQRVNMHYVSGQGEHTERKFDPYGLAYWAGSWYALGMCHLRHDLRSFRLDRVGAIALMDFHFRRPVDFDALDQLMRNIASMPRNRPIEVLLHTDLKRASSAFSLSFGLLEPTDDGVLLRASADDLGWFARKLAGLPFDFEIRTPVELRTELTQLAKRLQALANGS